MDKDLKMISEIEKIVTSLYEQTRKNKDEHFSGYNHAMAEVIIHINTVKEKYNTIDYIDEIKSYKNMRNYLTLETVNDLYNDKQITAKAVRMLVKKLCTKKAIKQYMDYLKDLEQAEQIFKEGE